jgi:hypothetical protein
MEISAYQNNGTRINRNVVGVDEAIKNADNIYGRTEMPAPQVAPDSDELRKDIRRLTFALKDVIGQLNDLKISHSKLEKNFNDMLVGQRPRIASTSVPADARHQFQAVNAPTLVQECLLSSL